MQSGVLLGGPQAGGYRPSSSNFAAGMGSPSSSVPKKAEFDIRSIMLVSCSMSLKFFNISHSLLILPDLRSTTMWLSAVVAFAMLPRLEAPINTVLLVLCSVNEGGTLRQWMGRCPGQIEFFVQFRDESTNQDTFFSLGFLLGWYRQRPRT